MADVYTQQNDLNLGAIGTDALTLAQAALLEEDHLKRGVLELFTEENPILNRIPWVEITGNSLAYDYEVALPGVGFRSVNEGYTVKHGRVGQRSVTLAIFGGDLDVDRFIIKTRSSVNNQRAIQEAMQLKAMSKAFSKWFFDGNRSTSGNEQFDGVNVLLADTYHTNAGSAGIGNDQGLDMAYAPLTNGFYAHGSGTGTEDGEETTYLQTVVDRALDLVIGGNSGKVILANKTFRRHLTRQARTNAQITIDKDEYGFQVTSYNGVPILEIEDDEAGDEILGFDETVGSATTASSFYVCRFDPAYLTGLQNGGVDVRDLGELNDSPKFRTRVEWFNAIAIMHPRAVCRVKGLLSTYKGDNNP